MEIDLQESLRTERNQTQLANKAYWVGHEKQIPQLSQAHQ